MNPVHHIRNSMTIRLLCIIACLTMMAFAVHPTIGEAYSSQLSATDDAQEAIIKAERALKTVNSLRYRLERSCGDWHVSIVSEATRSGRSHTIDTDSERIFIGGDLYIRKGNGPWEKLTPINGGTAPYPLQKNQRIIADSTYKGEATTSDFSRVPEAKDTKLREQHKDAKLIGQDILDNVPVLVYQYTIYDASGNKLLSTNKIWIGAQDGLPHRTETEVEAAFSEKAPRPCKMKTIMTYYDFNAEIVIEPPPLPPTKTAAEAQPPILDEHQRQAVQAAGTWLKLIDAGKFSEGWEAAAQCLKAKVSKDPWETRQRYNSEQAKAHGTIKSRKLKTATFVKSLPSIRDQEGIVLEYESALETSGSVSETVELVLEQDQVWRVAMYRAMAGRISLELPPGSGSGGGIGSGSGGGIGLGSGVGLGPGHGFNTGGNSNPNAPAMTVDQRPVPLNSPSPRYTEAARQNGVEGVVILRVLIGSDGSVKQVNVRRGLPDGLDEEAIHAAYQLRFKPAMKDGKPVAFWQAVQVEFHLGKR